VSEVLIRPDYFYAYTSSHLTRAEPRHALLIPQVTQGTDCKAKH
jgi:hypothetical protein